MARGKHTKARATTAVGREAQVNRLNVAAFRACDAADAAAPGRAVVSRVPQDVYPNRPLAETAAPAEAVQERLGHKPQDVTDGYTHVEAADRVEILRVLGELWDQASVLAPQAEAQ